MAVNRAITPQSEGISHVLFDAPRRTFDTVARLDSNARAIDACVKFSVREVDLLAVVGPAGCGKSHLLEIASHELATNLDMDVRVYRASEYLASAPTDTPTILILDDVHEIAEKKRPLQHLYWMLERRVRAKRPVLLSFTGRSVNRSVKNSLPMVRDWEFAGIGNADLADRRKLCTKLIEAEGLTVSPQFVEILSRHMNGTGRTFAGALKRLKLTTSSWTGDRMTLAACGAIGPFFEDSGDWDLAHAILHIAHHRAASFPSIKPTEMALHTMMKVAELSETQAARCLDIAPGVAYSRCRTFAKHVDGDEHAAHQVEEFVRAVVRELASHG